MYTAAFFTFDSRWLDNTILTYLYNLSKVKLKKKNSFKFLQCINIRNDPKAGWLMENRLLTFLSCKLCVMCNADRSEMIWEK